jgi:hypothetical protein
MLDSHNRLRAGFGLDPLAWDASLAADAAAYAANLAAHERFEHARQPARAEPQGENLWMGTRGAYSYAAMAEAWREEEADFVAGRFPDVSRTGDYADVGHFTQMIWQATRRVGCAVAASARFDYLVCRYLPAGNFEGERMPRRRSPVGQPGPAG